jgi:hypothetical protein
MDARSMEASLTDQDKSPPEIMFTVATIFNFDDGLIRDPDDTRRVTKGAKGSRIVNWMTLSHLRLSSALMDDEYEDLPLITILNTSAVVTREEEELTVTTT